jgi:hypothetical protein
MSESHDYSLHKYGAVSSRCEGEIERR